MPSNLIIKIVPTAVCTNQILHIQEDYSAATGGGRRNRFLPAGATQVGGAPLTCPKTKKTKEGFISTCIFQDICQGFL